MQPSDSPFAFGYEIDLSPSIGAEHPDGAASQKNAARIAVPRVGRPAPRVADPLAVNARLLAAATKHLLRYGSKRVTITAVAAEADTSHANVYRHFTSKDALLDAAAESWLRNVEAELVRIGNGPERADDKIEHLLTALAGIQREALVHEPNLFAVHLGATVGARPIAKRHRVRLRSLVERVIEEGIAAGTFVACDRERAITHIFDASYRFTHPLAIQQDVDLPRDLVEARLGAVILAIQKVLRTGTR
jgi:AcrR family transcriptional regulator